MDATHIIQLLITFVIFFALGYFTTGYLARPKHTKHYNPPMPCPHGYDDWDDCPDCRH